VDKKVNITEEVLGPVDHRYNSAPALRRLVVSMPSEARAVEEIIEGWSTALGDELGPYARGLLEELAIVKFLESSVIGKLADNHRVVDEKGNVSQLIQAARQLSETVARLQDRLAEQLPKKTPKAVNVAELWAQASRQPGEAETAPVSPEEAGPGTDASPETDDAQEACEAHLERGNE